MTNPDPVGHNANINFFNNPAVNFTIPPGGEKSVNLTKAEPAPIPAVGNIHPWMRADVVVLDHPFMIGERTNEIRCSIQEPYLRTPRDHHTSSGEDVLPN